MDMLKRLLGFTNCHNEKQRIEGDLQPCVSGYFLYYCGYVFGNQPVSAEIQRAITCLMQKERRPFIFTFSDDNMIGMCEEDSTECLSFAMHRIVLSCVYAKNQKIVAVFYHNPDNPERDLNALCALECHIFLCKTREQARKFAERISDELICTIRRRRRMFQVEKENVPTRAFSRYVCYENFKPGKNHGFSNHQSEEQLCNGSSSIFLDGSRTTVASLDTEYRQTSSSGIFESFQDLDLACEETLNPSTVPKPQFYECPILVHRSMGTVPAAIKSDMQKIVEEDPQYDVNELSTLIDMTETNL